MKRFLIYIALMALALLFPVHSGDVARLRPVQVVQISKAGEQIVIQTDTGDLGKGDSAEAALEDLKATTPAVIYLDTARYLLVTEDAQAAAEALRGKLKDTVQMCLAYGDVLWEETASFLRVHGKLPRMEDWEAGQELPVLTQEEKRLIFSKKSEKKG